MGWLSIDRGRRAVKVCVCMECVYYIDVYDEIKPFEQGERWDTYIDGELDSQIDIWMSQNKKKEEENVTEE